MTFHMMLAGTAVLVALAGCGSPDQQPQRTRPVTGPPVAMQTVEATAKGCSVGPGGQADRDCDLGALNPEVHQETIDSTICVPGWTEDQRPSTSYTSPMRDRNMVLYYPPGTSSETVRQDHLYPLELGGDPRADANLWPQPVEVSYEKNAHGGRLKKLVCDRKMLLADAQREIWERWSH